MTDATDKSSLTDLRAATPWFILGLAMFALCVPTESRLTAVAAAYSCAHLASIDTPAWPSFTNRQPKEGS